MIISPEDTCSRTDMIFTRDAYILNALTKFNVPLIFESHNARLHTRHTILHRFLEKRLLHVARSPNFQCLFSISEALSKYWRQKGVPRKKLFAWHDGFDASLFKNPIDKNAAKLSFEILQNLQPKLIELPGKNPNVDIKIVNYIIDKKIVLATLDKNLKSRINNKILTIRNKKSLEII